MAAPPLHVPLAQVPPVKQRLPPLQVVPSAALVPVHCPDELHVAVPDTQSLTQVVPPVATGFEHAPVLVLHVPAVWHWSEAVQTTGLLPTHTPLWQASVRVQALLSLQLVPLPRSLHAVVLTAGWQLWHWVALTVPGA